jgi:hypothetical protein
MWPVEVLISANVIHIFPTIEAISFKVKEILCQNWAAETILFLVRM